MLTDENFWELLCFDMQAIACNRTCFLLFFYSCLKKGRSRLSAGQRRRLRTEHRRSSAFPKSPRVLKKNRTCDKLALAQLQAAHSLFWHYFAPPTVQWCQSACFPMKSSSACYHKCQCVLTITAGVCSGEEVNDQQATAVTTVQMDASIQKLLI